MTRLPAAQRRQAVLETACRTFCEGSYHGTTTAEIAREAGVSEPILYRHFPSKHELYLACLGEAWLRLSEVWDDALEREDDPREWIPAIVRAYTAARGRLHLVDLWMQALAEAYDDPEIAAFVRDQIREVHEYVRSVIERAQEAGAVVADRDARAEAWIVISLGLLGSIGRRLGGLLGDDFERVSASRRRWMLGDIENL
jgi:AcrR family transcriptional regulator